MGKNDTVCIATYPTQSGRISNDNETKLSASQRHIQTSRVSQEPHVLISIRSNTRQYDVVFLTTLISIHTGDFNLIISICGYSAQLLS